MHGLGRSTDAVETGAYIGFYKQLKARPGFGGHETMHFTVHSGQNGLATTRPGGYPPEVEETLPVVAKQ